MCPLEPVKPTIPVPRTPAVRRERRRQQQDQPQAEDTDSESDVTPAEVGDTDEKHTIDEYV